MTNIILGTVCLEIMWSEVQVNKATEIITLTAYIGFNRMEINHLFPILGLVVNSSTINYSTVRNKHAGTFINF